MNPAASLLYILIVWLLLIGQSEQACDAECILCSQDYTCSVCKVGFYVYGNYTLCSPCQQEGCTCTATQSCTSCIPGYYSDINQANTCSKCFYMNSGCTCSSYYGCDSCLPGYRRSSNGWCYTCRYDYCTCSSNGRCTGCRDGYYLGYRNGQGYCSVCSDKCKLCSGGATSCTKCNDGYFLSNNRCDACDPTCSVCTSMDLCSACTDGYHLRETVCCPGTCTSCTSSTICSACTDGYHLRETVCCPDTCTSCSSSTTCTACATGRYGTTCQSTCSVGCIDNVCDLGTGVCTAGCKNGYYGTTECPCPVNCKYGVCNIGDGSCSQGCRDGYYGNTCTEICSYNCLRCTDLPQCQTCKPGWNGQLCGQKCPENCKDKMCDQSTGNCLQCIDGYFGESCTSECPANCKNKMCDQSTGNCLQCIAGYFGGTCMSPCPENCTACVSLDRCTGCVDGFYLNSQTCNRCSNNCNRCGSSSCDTCAEGYVLEWRDNKSVCEQCPSNCLVCSHSTSCSTCMTGYYRYKSGSTYLCAQCQPECTDCRNDGCYQCKQGFYSTFTNSAYQCYNCSEGCKSCSSNTKCYACQDGYYTSEVTLCQPCMDNCKTCGTANTCTECYPGYMFKDNVCQQDCPVNCKNNLCSVDKERCTAGCRDGYYGLKCDQICSTNCISCDQNSGSCTICETGFYGDYCSHTCSSGCKTTNGTTAVCNIVDGSCTDGCQLSTEYGPQCSKDCSVYCGNQECDSVTARCLTGCQPGYHGGNCTFPCNTGCINESCHGNNGSCTSGCKEGFTGGQCIAVPAPLARQPIDGGMIGGAVGGVVAALLIIAGVVVGVCLLRHRRGAGKTVARNGREAVSNTGGAIYENQVGIAELALQRSSKVCNQEHDRPSSEVKQDAITAPIRESTMSTAVLEPEDEESNVVMDAVVDVTSEGYYNVGTLTRSVTLEELPAFVAGKSELKYKQEFKLLPQGLIKPHDESQKPVNLALNRYKSIYPYDETRVILRDGGTDYVNASYMDGYKEPKAYIAALGSTKNTIPDIWRMVWQEKVGKIVMLTNLVELGTTKCELYWPDKGLSRNYTGIDVTTRAEEVYAEFIVRQFTLQKTGESRKVTHLHYTAWPDKGVPDDVTSLVEFRQKVEATSSTLEGPLLVHCSAGIGRTGTYLALDILTKEGEAEGSVNIMGCVVKMREQRVNMVQTDEQFTYLHHAIVHSLTFHSHHVTGSSFEKHVHALCEADANQASQIESIFKLIQKTLEKKKKVDEESIALNKTFTNKNRSIDAVPADRYRARLHLSLKPGSSDYINAVFINSYKRKNGLVLTQTPLPDTVVDFWRLVVQERTPCVVSMDDPLVENKTAVTYWPNKSDNVTFGIFRIKKTKSVTDKHCVINTLNVEYHDKSAVRTHMLTQFIFKGWSNTETVPPSPESLVLLIDQVERMKSQYEESDGPIIVHCLSGSERSGLFCTVSILLEKMKTEQEVSVVNIVRSLKSRRSQVIPNLEQYTFCYRAVVMYLESFNMYSNFELK